MGKKELYSNLLNGETIAIANLERDRDLKSLDWTIKSAVDNFVVDWVKGYVILDEFNPVNTKFTIDSFVNMSEEEQMNFIREKEFRNILQFKIPWSYFYPEPTKADEIVRASILRIIALAEERDCNVQRATFQGIPIYNLGVQLTKEYLELKEEGRLQEEVLITGKG